MREYWNARIHDLEMTTQPVGTRAFFDELDAYRFDKLAYLPELIDFGGFRGKRLVEVGCGVGTDLARFAAGGAKVLGVDLSETAIGLARANLALHHLNGRVVVADGGELPLPDASVDVFYAHGVLQYAAEPVESSSKRFACSGPAAPLCSWSTTGSPGSSRCRRS